MINIPIKKALLIILIFAFFVSLGINGWLVYQLSLIVKAYETQAMDTKTLEFTRMFVEDILMADTEISFDTRLTLETAVRGLNDQEVLDQWQKFTKTTTKEDASSEAKNLLDLLVKKIGR